MPFAASSLPTHGTATADELLVNNNSNFNLTSQIKLPPYFATVSVHGLAVLLVRRNFRATRYPHALSRQSSDDPLRSVGWRLLERIHVVVNPPPSIPANQPTIDRRRLRLTSATIGSRRKLLRSAAIYYRWPRGRTVRPTDRRNDQMSAN